MKMIKKLIICVSLLFLGCTQTTKSNEYTAVTKRTLSTTYKIVDSEDRTFYTVETQLNDCITNYITYRNGSSSQQTSQIVNKCK